MRMGSMAGYFLAFLVLLSGVCGCAKNAPADQPAEVPEEVPEEPAAPEVSPYRCPLDGAAVGEETLAFRPVAVVVDNHPDARPQTGLSEACLVYEIPVEGGLTRYLAIFLHGLPETLGPVRSVRHYFLDYASNHTAVIVHAGASPRGSKELVKRKYPSLNDMKGDPVFWRSQDRKMPHNLYTGMPKIRQVLEDKGYSGVVAEQHPFEIGEFSGGTRAPKLTIRYPAAGPSVEYTFDTERLCYKRNTNGTDDLDLSGGVIEPRNILVQYVKAWVIPSDTEGRLDMETCGKGKALAFSEGFAREATWEKPSASSPLVFLDEDGGHLTLSPGQTWVQVVTESTAVTY